MLYLLFQWGPVSYELGVGLGSLLMAQATMSASLWAWAQTRRVDAAKEVRFDSCFKERRRVLRSFMGTAGLSMGNPKFKGEPEDCVLYPSKLINPKTGKPHMWMMGESLSAEQQAAMAAVMDAHPENYSWGVDDLRQVHGYEYDFTLITGKPQFMRQYHLAQKEQEFAAEWVAELEAAGLVREISSPYAAPTSLRRRRTSTATGPSSATPSTTAA
jgi:hypothetical protein